MQFQHPSFVQEQRLKMNPQMLQSIKLMELPVAELRERIEQELERNPALELIEDKSTVPLEEAETGGEKYERFEATSDPGRRINAQASEEHRRFIEGVLTRPETLQEHLLRQLQLEPVDSDLRIIAETLIQNLDDDGFHKEKPETLFAETQPRLNEAKLLVQGLEPAGCCTGNYREALSAQIKISLDAPAEIHELERVLENLELLEREKYSVLAKKTGLGEDETRELCDYIKTLSPFPGRAFASMSNKVRYVVPDIKVVRDNNEFTINLNDEAFPVLGINANFEKFGDSKDQAARDFARENIREARLFI
ncbi:MAG: RNA polymerase sigma-54 factor, partial [Treponema sp.]|nr:RNA polymerase sigma-54 factor [Treponema sp.]